MAHSLFLALSLLSLLPHSAWAHEFWIEPEKYVLAPGDDLVASIRVGEEFKGSGFSFNPRNFQRFDIVTNGEISPADGRIGDRPALTMPAPEPGLSIVVHVTNPLHLTYTEAEKFENFLRHKDWMPLLDEHQARGLPETGFRERYIRFGKSLVGVGGATGEDAAIGLETEIVALANPYTGTHETLPVKVLYQDAPRPDAQVELFEKAPDGSVAITLHRTDADGIARLPVRPGHAYLADAVVIRALEPVEERDPVWESLWASLTFAVP